MDTNCLAISIHAHVLNWLVANIQRADWAYLRRVSGQLFLSYVTTILQRALLVPFKRTAQRWLLEGIWGGGYFELLIWGLSVQVLLIVLVILPIVNLINRPFIVHIWVNKRQLLEVLVFIISEILCLWRLNVKMLDVRPNAVFVAGTMLYGITIEVRGIFRLWKRPRSFVDGLIDFVGF